MAASDASRANEVEIIALKRIQLEKAHSGSLERAREQIKAAEIIAQQRAEVDAKRTQARALAEWEKAGGDAATFEKNWPILRETIYTEKTVKAIP